jgi:hypothetical protein
MNKHTPGPWKTAMFAGKINVWPVGKKKPDGSAVAYDCTEADARLIAAAPTMLSALQRIVAEAVPGDVFDTLAREAIAKATK